MATSKRSRRGRSRRGKAARRKEAGAILESHRSFHLLAIFSLCLLGLAAYSDSYSGPFLFDDHHSIRDNEAIHWSELGWSSVDRILRESDLPTRPVANISFALNYYFGELDVGGYHAVNVGIHLLSSVLVYLLALITLKRVGRGDDERLRPSVAHWTAWVAALVFVSHPIQTQAVTYTVQRMTSLCALFYLGALLLYAHGRVGATSRRRWAFWAGGLVSGILALGTKEIAATLPLIVVLYEWLFFQDMSLEWVRRNTKYALVVLALSGLAIWAYLGNEPWAAILAEYDLYDFSMGERLLTQFRVLVFYLSLLALPLPSRLNLTHDITTSQSLLDPITTLLSMILVFGLLGLAAFLARRLRLVSFCILWFFLVLLIESSIIALDMIFEHRLYLPMMGVSLLVSSLLFAALDRSPRWAVGIGVALALVLAVGTHQRNAIWQDAVTLWADAVDKNPNYWRSQYNLANALQRVGRNQEAIGHFRETVRLEPTEPDAHLNWGVTLEGQRQFASAMARYREALRHQPDYYPALNNLAWILATCPDPSLRNGDEAVELASRAAAMTDHEDPDLLDTLAAAHAEAGSFEEALRWQQKAVELAPPLQQSVYRRRLDLYRSRKPFRGA